MYRDAGPITNIEQANAFLNSLIRTDRHRPYRSRPAQVAVQYLLERIGNPHQRLKIIHIAGSKGKGSTALLTETILINAGRRVGTFTSPHLLCWHERFRIAGQNVDDGRLVSALERLRPMIGELRTQSPDVSLGFFDVVTAAAFWLFQEARVDCAIIEAGLGGRLDATNIVQPCATCITYIELEHTEQLGNSVEEIAEEKAGIIKADVPVVVGELPLAAAQVVASRAQYLRAPLYRLGQEIRLQAYTRQDLSTELWITCNDLRLQTRLSVPGQHLAHNAALAVVCAQQFGLANGELTEAIPRGFANVRLPGRSEILSRRPWVIVDVAHTRQSAQALAAIVACLSARRKHLLLGLTQDKNPALICPALLPVFDTITVTQSDNQRAWPAESLAAALRGLLPLLVIQTIPDPLLATPTLHASLADDDLLCVAGSVYLAGAVRPLLSRLCTTRRSLVASRS